MVRTRKHHCCKNWQIRNNSANVVAVLNPEIYTSGESDEHTYDNNTCYCRERRVPPKILPRPKQCVFNEDDFFKTCHLKNKLDSYFGESIRSYRSPTQEKVSENYKKATDFDRHVIVREKSKNSGAPSTNNFYDRESSTSSLQKQSFFKTHIDRNEENINQNTKTYFSDNDHSSEYEDADESDFPKINGNTDIRDYLKAMKSYEPENVEYVSSKSFLDTNKTYHEKSASNYKDSTEQLLDPTQTQLSTLGKPSRKDNIFSDLNRNEFSTFEDNKHSSRSDLKSLIDFRKDHYFETHSTQDLIKEIPEHVCVHRFGLNDRFLPQPLNADAYETSRCIICGKVMNDKQPVNKVDQRLIKKSNIFPKFYKYGLAPKKIYLGNNKDIQIEMVLDKHKNKICKLEVENRPNYFNTYALRYQKGVS